MAISTISVDNSKPKVQMYTQINVHKNCNTVLTYLLCTELNIGTERLFIL